MMFIMCFAGIQILLFFFLMKVMLHSRNHRLSSEESTLALFVRPESDLKAVKAEETAVALGKHCGRLLQLHCGKKMCSELAV